LLQAQHPRIGVWKENGNASEGMQHPQVVISTYDFVGVTGDGRLQELVVLQFISHHILYYKVNDLSSRRGMTLGF